MDPPDSPDPGKVKAGNKAVDDDDTWVLPNTVRFASWVTDRFARVLDPSDADDDLFPQQRFAREFMAASSPYRGIILYHGLGSGKTCSAITVAESLRESFRGGAARKIFILLPASLRTNYLSEVRKCGAPEFRDNQKWLKKPWSQVQQPPLLVNSKPNANAKQNAKVGGSVAAAQPPQYIWQPDAAGTPYADLSPSDRAEVRKQVDDAISLVHQVVGYNGLRHASILSLIEKANGFDDCVVIIDEVHNFVSRVINHGLLQRIYDALMTARRCRIILLSGTPLVNRPNELAILANLAHGPVTVFDYRVRTPLDARAAAQLQACPEVIDFRESATADGRYVVAVRFLPDGYERADDDGGVRRVLAGRAQSRGPGLLGGPGLPEGHGLPGGPYDDDGEKATAFMVGRVRVREILAATVGLLGGERRGGSAESARKLLLLPPDPVQFEQSFVDAEKNVLRNRDVLERRLSGLVSHFSGLGPELYPTVRSVKIETSPLSARQFSEYVVHRSAEIKREDAARRFAAAAGRGGRVGAGGDDASSSTAYRPLSRAICNFAFPADMPRPRRIAFWQAAAQSVDDADAEAADTDGIDPALRPTDPDQTMYPPLTKSNVAERRSSSRRASSAGRPDSSGQPPQPITASARTVDAQYLAALDDMVQKLRSMPDRLALAPTVGSRVSASQKSEYIEALSPKFAKVARQLVDLRDGTAIVYSHFRRAEGINLLAATLHANGFEEVRIIRLPAPLGAKLTPAESDDLLRIEVVPAASAPGATSKSGRSRSRASSASTTAAGHNNTTNDGEDDKDAQSERRLSSKKGGGKKKPVKSGAAGASRFLVYDNADPMMVKWALAIFNNQLDDLPTKLAEGVRTLLVPKSSSLSGRSSSSSDPDKKSGSSNLRGDLIRVLMITQSGAEGISTRNVRHVHVIEPFWHPNRIQQVIGRAVRAHSHDQLPDKDRTVDVHVHMAVFTPQQMQVPLVKRDKGKTSDQYIHDLAQRKGALLSALQDAMKVASVDCRLHLERHRAHHKLRAPTATTNLRCFTAPPGLPRGSRLYADDLQDDLKEAAVKRARLQDTLVRVSSSSSGKDGSSFHYVDPATGNKYDGHIWEEARDLVLIA